MGRRCKRDGRKGKTKGKASRVNEESINERKGRGKWRKEGQGKVKKTK